MVEVSQFRMVKIISRNFELNNSHDKTFDGEAYTFTNIAEVQNLEELVKNYLIFTLVLQHLLQLLFIKSFISI